MSTAKSTAKSTARKRSRKSKPKVAQPKATDAAMQVETIPIATLTADPANVRTHDERNLESITCYGMEISPQYTDIIVTRWQNLTNNEATLLGGGRTFNAIAIERGAIERGA